MSIRRKIERDTQALAMPRGRRVGQPGHDVARNYLLQRMTEFGLVPFKGDGFALPFERAHPITGIMTEFTNLVGRIPGTDKNCQPLLIGAHYDSVIDGPCADDNATAVAVVLATAERFVSFPLTKEIIVAIFDSEEPPFFLEEAMGSKRFYEDHCADIDFSCAIILDLIGHDVEIGEQELEGLIPDMRDLIFVMGSESDRSLPSVVEQAAARVTGLRVFPTLNEYVGDMSDHHAFRLGGQPFLFLSCGQGRYYHQQQDDMDWINLDKIVRVHDLLSELLVAAQEIETTHSAERHDPVDFEIRMIKRAIGDPLTGLLTALGLRSLSSRNDLTQLISALRNLVRA